jgi:hypothetical protein
MPRGGKREGAGRKPGRRNNRTLMAMELREQFLKSSYSPLTILQKNIRWAQDEAEQLQKALGQVDFASMDAAKIEALNETRKQVMALRSKANEVAAMAAPYVQPKPAVVDEPINIDVTAVVTAEDLVTANNNLVLAVANGEISPEEGAKVSAVLESRRKAIELLEMEKRIAALEAKKGIGR